MFFRVVASSVLALGLCLPLIGSAHGVPKHQVGEVQHGDVTYYYTAKGRVYAKKIGNIKYYRSSPRYLYKVYPRSKYYYTYKRYPYHYRHRYNGRYGYDTYQDAPYYTQYVYVSHSSYPYRYYQYRHYRAYPYHGRYTYSAPRNYEYRYYHRTYPYYYRTYHYRW